MKPIHLTVSALLLTAGLSSTANAFRLSGGAPFTPVGLDLIRCSAVHSHSSKTANIEVSIYNAAGTQVATNTCNAQGFAVPWV